MKFIKKIILMTIVSVAFYIVLTDLGVSTDKSSGAGDIWWTDTVEIELAYRNIVQKIKN